MRRGEQVERERRVLDLPEAFGADELDRPVGVDVLVVTFERLRRRGEDRLGQSLRFDETGRQVMPRRRT